VCITKREAVSYLQYVDDLDFVYQKGGNSVMPTVCLCSRLCVSERVKLSLTNSMFMILSASQNLDNKYIVGMIQFPSF
jgi:hypothetical protein